MVYPDPSLVAKEMASLQGTADERIFNRYSPYYIDHFKTWIKAISAYNGGRSYLEKVLKQHPSESPDEYNERLNSAYNLNLIKYAVNEFGNYIFSRAPRREALDELIASDFDRQKKPVNDVMWDIFRYHNLCGLVWVLVDMPVLNGNVIDIATKTQQKIRPYCKVLSPLSVVDWCFNELGELDWIIIQEYITEKKNPASLPVLVKKRVLYTKEYYQMFTQTVATGNTKASAISYTPTVHERRKNELGIVPVIPYSEILMEREFNTPEISDILTIFDAVLAGESELLTNILKQTYGQLVLPMSLHSIVTRVKSSLAVAGIDINAPTTEAIVQREVATVLSRTKAIYEDGDERGIARYIQPTGAEISGIINHNDRLIALIMKIAGFLVGVATTQRESADSKGIDNVSLASQLIRIASRLEDLENNIWRLFNKFDSTIQVPKVMYNKDYDIHEFRAVIQGIVEFANINGGEEFCKQVKRTAVHAMDSIHRIPDGTWSDIMKEIESNNLAKEPVTFEAQAKHLAEKSGSSPDSVAPKNPYTKSATSVGKTQGIS